MAVLACLGRANSWFTIPFLVVISLVAVAGIVVPDRMPGRKPPRPWMGRLLGVVILVVAVGVLIPKAVDEARTDPDCMMEDAAAHH